MSTVCLCFNTAEGCYLLPDPMLIHCQIYTLKHTSAKVDHQKLSFNKEHVEIIAKCGQPLSALNVFIHIKKLLCDLKKFVEAQSNLCKHLLL